MKITPLLSIVALGLAAPVVAQEAGPAAPDASTAEAPAAQAATAKAGDTVYDPSGAVVGTVESVSGDNFVISTGSNKATLPMAALASGPKGPTLSINKSQLEAAIQQAGKAN